MLLVLLACDGDAGDTGEPPPCDTSADTPYTFPAGTWSMSIDAVAENGCENAAGNGLHLDIGEITIVEFEQGEGDCLSGEEVPEGDDEPAMSWAGALSGSDAFDLQGFVEVEFGTCVYGVEATMAGTVVSDSELAWSIDGTIVVVREGGYLQGEDGELEWTDIPGSCDLIVGDEEHHTFPELPCDAAWSGSGTPE